MDCIKECLEFDPSCYLDEYRGYSLFQENNPWIQDTSTEHPDDEPSDDISWIVYAADDTSYECDTTEYD
jgi:hypothetical protein